MSQKLPNMLDNTIAKIREMVSTNTVIGDPIAVGENVTIIPVSNISIGLAGGGSDFVSKHPNKYENPFGGGVGAGVKVTPVAFLIIKDGCVRMMPVATPANTTTERLVEMIPETLDKVVTFIESRIQKAE